MYYLTSKPSYYILLINFKAAIFETLSNLEILQNDSILYVIKIP